MLTENVQAIASSLRNGILRLGRTPKIALQDNGKAFHAKFFEGCPSFEECGFYGLFGRLKIIPRFSEPYNARSKVIERVWREFVESGEKLIPSFTGVSPLDKPAYIMRNEPFHKKLHEKKFGTDGVAITMHEAKGYIDEWLKFYRSQECPHVKGKEIGEVFNGARTLDNPIKEELLDDLMMQLEPRDYKVGRNGVNLLGARYYAPEMLNLVNGHVQVKVSLFDYSYVKIFNCDGTFFCRAERQEKIHPMAHDLGTPIDQQDFKEKLKIHAKVKKDAMKNVVQFQRWQQGAGDLLLKDGTHGMSFPVETGPIALPEATEVSIDSSEKIKTYLDD